MKKNIRIIGAINDYAKKIKIASVWKGTNSPIQSAVQGKPDYIYEFYCYIRIICTLKSHYSVLYEKGAGNNTNKFPRKPAKKKDRPRFIITQKDNQKDIKCQICAGTKIRVVKGDKCVAPDISFQRANSPDDPSAADIFMIMDAKYNSSSKKALSKMSYNYFSGMIHDLGLRNKTAESFEFEKGIKLEGNYLISYGKAYTDDLQYLKSHNICEIEKYNESGDYATYIPV